MSLRFVIFEIVCKWTSRHNQLPALSVYRAGNLCNVPTCRTVTALRQPPSITKRWSWAPQGDKPNFWWALHPDPPSDTFYRCYFSAKFSYRSFGRFISNKPREARKYSLIHDWIGQHDRELHIYSCKFFMLSLLMHSDLSAELSEAFRKMI